jgi:hypothetical protein
MSDFLVAEELERPRSLLALAWAACRAEDVVALHARRLLPDLVGRRVGPCDVCALMGVPRVQKTTERRFVSRPENYRTYKSIVLFLCDAHAGERCHPMGVHMIALDSVWPKVVFVDQNMNIIVKVMIIRAIYFPYVSHVVSIGHMECIRYIFENERWQHECCRKDYRHIRRLRMALCPGAMPRRPPSGPILAYATEYAHLYFALHIWPAQ